MFNKLFAFLMAVAMSAPPSQMDRPIALDKNSRTRLYVLDSRGNVFVRENSVFRFFASIPFGSRPVDIVSVNFGNQEYVFVCSALIGQNMAQQNASGSPSNYGLITEFGASGDVMKQWRLPDLCGGFDITPEHILYFAGAHEPVVFSFSVDDSYPKFRTSGYIKGARTLGPLIFDDVRKRIYTADVASGTLFLFDPSTGETHIISDAFGEPSALALSPDRDEIYVADSSKRSVLKLSLQKPGLQPMPFSDMSFQRPSGLAPGAGGHLWVADPVANLCIDVAPTQETEKGKSTASPKNKAATSKRSKR